MADSRSIIQSALEFEVEAKRIFSYHETSIHRVADLKESYSKLDSLSVAQDDMLRQSLRCIELQVFRGAHVLAWAAVADFLQRYAAADGFTQLNAIRPRWAIRDLDHLRDEVGEFALIEAMKEASLLTKGEKKGLHGLLNKRNECAHPTDYFPDLNQSLGFVSECIDRLSRLYSKYHVS